MLNDRIVKELPPAPKNVVDWLIENAPQKTYLIFNKKKNEVRCTRCGSVFTIDECLDPVVHNSGGSCPCCDYPAEYKESRYGRKGLAEYGRVLIFTRKRQTIYASLSEYIIDYKDEKPKVYRNITDIYKLNKKIQKRYHFNYWSDRWLEYEKISVPHLFSGSYWTENKFENVIVYDENFDIFDKSDFKYDDVADMYSRYEMLADDILCYLNETAKYPAIEMLRKVGFDGILNDRICRRIKGGINIRGKNLKSILRLPDMGEVKKWMYTDISIAELEKYKEFKAKGIVCNSTEEIRRISEMFPTYDSNVTMERIEKVITIKEAVKYFKKQPRSERYGIARDYCDYLKECEKLKMDLNDKRILFPKNLREAHMRCSIQIEVTKNKEKSQKIKERAEKMSALNYSSGELFIRVAESAEEIISEGKIMRHCVGGYVDRVAESWTNIFFVRKVDEPDKPYYTLELSEGSERRVVQCRGKCNSGMTDEVKAFVDEWIENVVNKKKIKEAA